MRLYFYRTPWLLKKIYKPCTWKKATDDKVLYLTFDDGPVPEATPYVLDLLEQYNAKATFFVVGDNVRKYPDIFASVIGKGHAVGNHTYHHLKGWNHTLDDYLENVEKCQAMIEANGYLEKSRPLFRPPYGRIKMNQLAALSERYEVVMWEVLSGDFDLNLNFRSSFHVLKKAKPGDIIVFHDSQKYLQNVKELLPKFLDHFSQLGYTFATL
jgi:peptidoglycan/xylan/chitin deacetylase (PgdA/CDA1 family)